MKLIEENETKTFNNIDDFQAAIDFRTANDRIMIARIRDLQIAKRRSDESAADFKARVHASMPEDVIEEHKGLFLDFNTEINGVMRHAVLPLREIALDSLYERAKVTCFTITNEDSTDGNLVMDPFKKIDFINDAFKLYGGNAQILFRDQKITSVMSSQYYHITMNSLNNAILALKEDFPQMQFKDAVLSHEFFRETYLLNSDELEEDILLSLKDAGIDAEDVSVEVTGHTCDYGKIAATFSGVINIDGKKLLFGSPESVKHAGKKTEDDVKKKAIKLYSSFKDNAEKIKHLPEVHIDHPDGCFRLIAKEFHLPKKISCELAKALEGRIDVTAYEIYWMLNRVVFAAEEKGMDMLRIIILQEMVAKTLNASYKSFDREFLWNRGEYAED